MTADELVEELRNATALFGGIVKWAEENNVHPSVVSDVLRGRREPTPQLLTAMGLRLVKVYEPLGGGQ